MEEHLAEGKAVYLRACAECHDAGQNGAPVLGATAAWSMRSPEWPTLLKRHATEGFVMMPPKGGHAELSEDEVAAAVDFMTSQIAPPSLPPLTLDLVRGREVYTKACSRCHDVGVNGAPVLGDRAAWLARSPEWLDVLKHHAVQGLVLMPPKGGHSELSDADVAAAVEYMVSRLANTK